MMKYKLLKKNDFAAFLGALKERYKILGPRSEGKQIKFAPISDAGLMCLDRFQNSTMSPKNIFFPQSEIMLSFRKSGEDANIYKEAESNLSAKAVFGIRPCDARAFFLLDMIFKNDQFTDTYWFSKRDATTLIGLGCNEPCSSCFCTSVDSHPFGEKGLDVLASDLGNRYLMKVLTKKGEKLLEGMSFLDDPKDKDLAEQRVLSKKAEDALSSKISLENIKSKTVLELYNQDCWSEVNEPCLNCGTCTYVCPTCHCFDIQDEVYRDGGVRIRNWDSCMSWLFTVHATGHNPRPSKKERVRQRFMHKFKYIPVKRAGEIGCVGCGRCVNLCPVNIDIREVVKTMNSAK
ncbi:MAG: 4Fe-4S dicluster domain-containing protein [Dissulfurispiraceae bacterium]